MHTCVVMPGGQGGSGFTRRLKLCVLLPALALLAACASSDSGGEAGSAVAPLSDASPPAGFRTHSLGPVSFAAPPDWQQVPTQAAQGVSELALRAPSAVDENAPVALALFKAESTRTAAEEANSTVVIKRDVHRAKDVRSRPVSLPGFTSAFLTSYDESGPGGGLLHTESLVGDLAGGGVFVINVKGSLDEFETGQLAAIVGSIRAGA